MPSQSGAALGWRSISMRARVRGSSSSWVSVSVTASAPYSQGVAALQGMVGS